ncbi:hypothetical protein FS749_008484 [Ceratobasidium sp. UAMH 11750]|nr:hypothetical protein FS749_008484 [Ceratobasidium sp. UAMH 11750]
MPFNLSPLSYPITATKLLQSQLERCLLSLENAGSSLAVVEVFAQSLIGRGKKAYIAGRTEPDPTKTAKEIGVAGYFVVDVGDSDSLPAFAEKVFKEALEVDCLISNAVILIMFFTPAVSWRGQARELRAQRFINKLQLGKYYMLVGFSK